MLPVSLTRSTKLFSFIHLSVNTHYLKHPGLTHPPLPTPCPHAPTPTPEGPPKSLQPGAPQRVCKLAGLGPTGVLFGEEGDSHTIAVEDFTLKSIFLAPLENNVKAASFPTVPLQNQPGLLGQFSLQTLKVGFLLG